MWLIAAQEIDDDAESLHYITKPEFSSPQELLDHVKENAAKYKSELGISGLIFMHILINRNQITHHYFNCIKSANRFHKSLTAKQPA